MPAMDPLIGSVGTETSARGQEDTGNVVNGPADRVGGEKRLRALPGARRTRSMPAMDPLIGSVGKRD